MTLAQIASRAQRLKNELLRRDYLEDPVKWARERLGVQLWSKQEEILWSIANYRKTEVVSCHEMGKSFIAGLAAGWWIDCHLAGEAFIVTSAPSAPQVKTILWKEIARVHTRGGLRGRLNQTEWLIEMVGGKEEIVGFGRKPDEYNPTALQGIHAPFVLVIFDEAGGIRGPLWESADSLIANDLGKFLGIGNPDDPDTEFHRNAKPGSGYNVIQVSAFDTPNFTGEDLDPLIKRQLIGKVYVEEKRRKWAPGWRWSEDGRSVIPGPQQKATDANPFWLSKVMGVFPEGKVAGGLIPVAWIRAAQNRTLEPKDTDAAELGVDVGAGGDDTVVVVKRGDQYRIRRTSSEPDTMLQCGMVVNDLEEERAVAAKIDKIGIGWGMVNRGVELGKPFYGINVGESPSDDDETATDDRFANLKAELYWNLRDLFERGMIDIEGEDTPYGEDLAAELAGIRWERNSKGKIKISDKKKDENGHAIPSPNKAEALMLAASPIPTENNALTW